MTTIYKSLSYDQLPATNVIDVKEGDTISLVTYKLPDGATRHDCDYVYLRERLGTVKMVNADGSFMAHMESVSGHVSNDYDFTLDKLTTVIFAGGKMAHVLYKL